MAPEPLNSIMICMGSSCFSRGNNRNIEVIQEHLAMEPLPAGLELTGHLCEGHCKAGPNVTINGKMYHEVDPIVIIGLLSAVGTALVYGIGGYLVIQHAFTVGTIIVAVILYFSIVSSTRPGSKCGSTTIAPPVSSKRALLRPKDANPWSPSPTCRSRRRRASPHWDSGWSR